MHVKDKFAHKAGRSLALGAALLWLAGCYPPSALDLDYGNSVHNNIAQHVLNPRAGLNPTPTVGLPPEAAVNEMDRYSRSFEAEKVEKRTLQGVIQSSGQSK